MESKIDFARRRDSSDDHESPPAKRGKSLNGASYTHTSDHEEGEPPPDEKSPPALPPKEDDVRPQAHTLPDLVHTIHGGADSSVLIQPTNYSKTYQKECSVSDAGWLDRITHKYLKKRQQKMAKFCSALDLDIYNLMIWEINRVHWIPQLKRNLKPDFKLTDYAELEQEPTVDIPQLAPRQESMAKSDDLIGEFNQEHCISQLQQNLKPDLKLTDDAELEQDPTVEIPQLAPRQESMAKSDDLIGEFNREHCISQLLRKLKHDLRLSGDAELEQEPAVEISQLTPRQESMAKSDDLIGEFKREHCISQLLRKLKHDLRLSGDSELEQKLAEEIPQLTPRQETMKSDDLNEEFNREQGISQLGWKFKHDLKLMQDAELEQEPAVEIPQLIPRRKMMAKSEDSIGELNREKWLSQLERKFKRDLKLKEDAELKQKQAVEIPKLTPELERMMEQMLGPGPAGELVTEMFNLTIYRENLQTLASKQWLDDTVISFYMELIRQRSEERRDLPRACAFSAFFYPLLLRGGHADVKSWTSKVDIFAHQLLVIPVHLTVRKHWCLCLVNLEDKWLHYLDSMGVSNHRCLEVVLQYLRDEHQHQKGRPLDEAGWTKVQVKTIPQQRNGFDCGVFTCAFAEYATRRAAFTFTQADMPRLRRKITFEILQGKLIQ